MSLSKNAIVLLDYLSTRYGRRISESEIRAALNISHGTFINLRHELVARALISCEVGGGNKSPIYRSMAAQEKALPAESSAPVVKTVKEVKAETAIAALMEEIAPMERVTGQFSSRDDWESALIDALGDCIDVDHCAGGVSVYSHAHGQTELYKIVQGDDGIDVR